MEYFNIKEDYLHNLNPQHHNDIGYTDQGQLEVYEFVKQKIEILNYTTIIDVGCGSGYKLMKLFLEYNTIGYEVEPCLSKLRELYPDRVWVDSGEPEKSFNKIDIRTGDIIICADVIEHIINPIDLIEYLLSFNVKHFIISTPCRDVLCNSPKYYNIYNRTKNGPPLNKAHVREWTMDEFKNFLKRFFIIEESYHGKNQIECQYHLLKRK